MLTRYVERNLTWIDLTSPTPGEVRSLMREYALDPLIAEELLVPSYKPKVERRGEHIYCILHFPVLRGAHPRPEQEIDFIIGKNFLISARYGAVEPLHAFAKAFEVGSVLERQSGMTHGGHLFAAMARSLYQALLGECDALRHRLHDIEERVFNGDERRMVVELSQTGRAIYDFRQALQPHQEILSSLEPVASRLFGPEYSFYVRGLQGEFERVRGAVEHLRESLVELRETNNSLLSTKQNEIMKTLTVLAFLFLPLTFIGQVFGMSSSYIPLVNTPDGFWIIIGSMAIIALGSLTYFKYKGWL